MKKCYYCCEDEKQEATGWIYCGDGDYKIACPHCVGYLDPSGQIYLAKKEEYEN